MNKIKQFIIKWLKSDTFINDVFGIILIAFLIILFSILLFGPVKNETTEQNIDTHFSDYYCEVLIDRFTNDTTELKWNDIEIYSFCDSSRKYFAYYEGEEWEVDESFAVMYLIEEGCPIMVKDNGCLILTYYQ